MPVIRGLFISFIFHLLVSWLLLQVPDSWSEKPRQRPLVEIELVNPSGPKAANPLNQKTDDRQVVRQTVIPEAQKSMENDNAAARFLSATRQRVWLETRAPNSGMTKNRIQNKFGRPKKFTSAGKDYSGYEPVDFAKELREQGFSTVGEDLPDDLAVGSFTALNTDQYQFYSFYARVEELIRFRWETKVREAIDLFDRRNLLNRIGEKQWITQAVFLLNPKGRLQKILLLKESGLSAFDEAAMTSFQDALIFPNPPKEMVESDGFIHLKYSFNVHFNPSAIVNR